VGRLHWLCDIAELLRANTSLNWNSIISQASETVNNDAVAGIFLANRLLAAPVPQQLIPLLRADTHVTELADYVSARLFLCAEDKKLTEEHQTHTEVRRDR
jgi:hypothetical protein